jgi:ribonuclease BN (tRNA processing enzyme)
MMSPPSFPLEPDGLNGTWNLHTLEAGRFQVGDFAVWAAEISHKGGRTFGYRIEDSSGAVAYFPDHSPVQGCSDEARALVAGDDVLLHDAQFRDAERTAAHDYGHATIGEAIRLAVEGHVKRLVLFHHAPARTDDQLDEIAASAEVAGALIPVALAREGDEIVIG